jgi:TolB-like protein/thioredoxin-like negative regulator of GroEL
MAVYGVVAFGVLQIADLAFPRLGLPEWTVTFVLALSLLGFPIAVVLAWALEMTPEGVRRTEEAAPGELAQIAHAPASRRWPAGVLALVGTAALVWGAWYVGRRSSVEEVSESELRRSVAVLPFADLTNDDYSRAFALGLHDDLLTQLSRIEDLRVTSRTSVMAYAETDLSAGEIARELGVGTLVEGGVRTSGDRIRLNVQLIDPQSDEHLWAETYDREITAENVFAIQAEIASAVAERLEAELTPETRAALADLPTDNIGAWNAYNRARLLWGLIDEEEAERQTVVELETATRLDPKFLSAWALLVNARAWLIRQGLEQDTLPAFRALERLRSLAPESPQRYQGEGNYQYYAKGDFQAALTHFQMARRLSPTDQDAAEYLAFIFRRLGRWTESIDILDEFGRQDPMNPRLAFNQAINYQAIGEFEEATRLFELAEQLNPSRVASRTFFAAMELFGKGDIKQARAVIERPPAFGDGSEIAASQFWQRYFNREFEAAIDAIRHVRGRALQIPASAGGFEDEARVVLMALAYAMADDRSAARVMADSGVAFAMAELYRRPEEHPIDRFGRRATAHSSLALALALRGTAGDFEAAAQHGRQAVALYNLDIDALNGDNAMWTLARVYALTGRNDEALGQLAEIMSRPGRLGPGALRLDPIWDPIRDDPRFDKLIVDRENFSIRIR